MEGFYMWNLAGVVEFSLFSVCSRCGWFCVFGLGGDGLWGV